MKGAADLLASSGIVLLTGFAFAGAAVRAQLFGTRLAASEEDRRTASLSRMFRTATLEVLGPVARSLAGAGVSANAVTACSFAAGLVGGVLAAFGHFGLAAVAIVLGSLGDGIDGLIARRTGTASPAGALFDASVDRYEEFFLFGGLAYFFRASGLLFCLALAALAGSYMVSYGSAKAEAFRVAVPKGIMRREDRAVVMAVGITLAPIAGAVGRMAGGASWAEAGPVVLAAGLVAVLGNASAVARLRAIARAASPTGAPALPTTEPLRSFPVDGEHGEHGERAVDPAE
jgi:CDP-diacylglycerol--glycerol-3-phosphate 3-phosphatidyltransferase